MSDRNSNIGSKPAGDRQQPAGFVCSQCGKFHAELPFEYGVAAPEPYYAVAESQRKTRCELSEDLCVIDGEHFFIRGCIEIPVLDGPRPFTWGVWASLSRANFQRTAELWESPAREQEPPYFGWLCTALPLYPETLHLKTHVHTRSVGQRPYVELERTDHPLAIEQREGIPLQRIQQIAEALLHP